MPDALHILLVNNYTDRGGVPKATATLANGMVKRGHKVTVFSQKPVPRFLYPLYRLGHSLNRLSLLPGQRPPLPLGTEKFEKLYPLDAGIRIIPYSFSDKNLKIQKLRARIKALNPDVCAVFLPDGSHLVWAVALLGSGVPFVYSERTAPDVMENVFWNRKGRLAAMSGADAIHLLLPSYRQSVPDFLAEKVAIIPNAVKIPDKIADTSKRQGPNTLLWLGRFYEEAKQCRVAIDAFAKIAHRFPDWELRIAGYGPDREIVRRHAAAYNLGQKISFLGRITNSGDVMSEAQAFCLSSKMEGMPNTLLEAMAAGLPCVAFGDCPSVADIISDGKTGLLAGDMNADALGARLVELMESPGLREKLGSAAREKMKTYAPETILGAWEDLLIKSAAKKGNTAMDAFAREPFASMARMSSKARQEWAIRDFGQPMPHSLESFFMHAPKSIIKNCALLAGRRWRPW